MAFKLANVSDIKDNEGIVVLGPDGSEIALFKSEGTIYALDNTCPHKGGPLGEGIVEDGGVTCPWHGWQFDIRSGACQNMPGEEVPSIAIEVVNDEIFLK